MTTILSLAPRLDAPTPEAMAGGLLDLIQPIEGGSIPAVGGPLYTSLNCLRLPDSVDICTAPHSLTYDAPVSVSGARFATDIGVQCQSLAFGDLAEQFNRVVDLNESASVEQNLMVVRFTGTRGGAAAVDLTPAGGAVKPAVALAMLEGDASKGYVGMPTIHSPVSVASLLNSGGITLKQVGKSYRTAIGSKFVIGGGYEDSIGPGGTAPAAGEKWMYASGDVRLWRGPRLQLDPVLNRTNNLYLIRTQRIYVADVDCYLSAIRVSIT